MTSKSTTILKKLGRLSKPAWKPHGYQKKAVKFMLQLLCGGLFLDPGLGKTSITLAALKVLKQKGMLNKALIIAPLRVCYLVWPIEAKKWLDFDGLKVVILHGKDKEKLLESDADIFLINPEGLPWLLGTAIKAFRKASFNILVVDESTKFKATNTQRFKLLRPVLNQFDRRYILTGTPVPNGFLDLFGQVYIVDTGAALGKYITNYRNTYFYATGFGGYEWKLKEGSDDLITKRIQPFTLRMEAEDYIDLPEEIPHDVPVALPPAAMKVYKEMEREMFALIDRGSVSAVNAAVASGKCSQIANGAVYDEFKQSHRIHDAKIEAILDLLDEIGDQPVLIAYEYGHDLEALHKALGKSTPYLGGGVSGKRSAEIERAWNAGEISRLLGQPASMGHGLNFQKSGNHIIHYGLTWNFENYDQFNRRIRRQGASFDKVFVHRLIAQNTVDEAKVIALSGKNTTQKGLLNALKAYKERLK